MALARGEPGRAPAPLELLPAFGQTAGAEKSERPVEVSARVAGFDGESRAEAIDRLFESVALEVGEAQIALRTCLLRIEFRGALVLRVPQLRRWPRPSTSCSL